MLKDEFDESSDIISVLRHIARDQLRVYDELERTRKSLWLSDDGTSLFTGTTVIFTTHATAMGWYRTHLNRTWHHPRFDPQIDPVKFDSLRAEFVFEKIVFDEPEWDEFAYILPRGLYEHLSGQRLWTWRKLSVRERKEHFQTMKRVEPALATVDFEEYSELRFVDLADFDQVQVDYFSQPFGRENSQKSIYLARHGSSYYFCAKHWPDADGTNWIFLTTESFTTEAIAALYSQSSTGRCCGWSWTTYLASTRLMSRS